MAKVVAKVYGDALFDLAIENNELDEVAKEIQVLKDTLAANTELLQFLNHPKISNEEKIKSIEEIFKGKFSDTTVGFLVVVVTKNRYNELDAIMTYFLEAVREYRKIGKASITSAFELTKEQKQKIENKLLDSTEYVEFLIDYKVDPSIVGGLVIRIGDRVVDSSIKSKIELMRKDLMKLQLAD